MFRKKRRKPTDRQPTPGLEVTRETGLSKPHNAFKLDQFNIGAFATNHTDVDEVHLILRSDNENTPVGVMMFKSPNSIGFLIEELIAYRKHVWPDAEDINADARVQDKGED